MQLRELGVFLKATLIRLGGLHRTAVFWSLLANLLRFGGFLIVLPIALRALTAQEMGVWYLLQGMNTGVALLEAVS